MLPRLIVSPFELTSNDVTDPAGVLKEDEIHFKSTKNLKDPLEDMNPHQLLGEVLVIICPTQSPRIHIDEICLDLSQPKPSSLRRAEGRLS